MRATDLSRVGMGLAAYAFFTLSAWAPFHWDRDVRSLDRRATQVPIRKVPLKGTLELQSLAMQAPPPAIPDWVEPWVLRQALNAGRVSIQASVPAPRLAGLGRTMADATLDPPAPGDELASRPVAPIDVAPAAPLAPADLDAELQRDAEPQTFHWQRPQRLLSHLTELARHAECADWANDALHLIEQLTKSDVNDRQAKLAALQQSVAQAGTLLESLDRRSLSVMLRRAQYALERHVAIWRGLNQIELRSATAPQIVEIQPDRLAHCLADVMEITETGTGSNWRDYLLVESLSELARTRSSELDAESRRLARRVLERLAHAKTALPQTPFVTEGPLAALDTELRNWAAEPIDAAQLLASLEEYEQTGLPGAGRLVAAHTRHLSFSPLEDDQALSRQIDAHYRNANLRIAVSEAMFNRMLPKQQPTTTPVVDTILGLPVSGRKTTETELAVKLLPGSTRLRLELAATGLVNASTRSESGPVTVFTNSHSHYTARKVLEFAEHGVITQPARAEAESQSRLRCIETDLDGVPLVGSLMESYAKDQYAARREQARMEIQAKVEHQARERIDSLAETRFEQLHDKFADRVLTPLDRLQLKPSFVETVTEDGRFTMRVRLAGPHQLAAFTPRPRALSDSLMSVQIHESAINNIVDQLQLAGKELTYDELRSLLAEKLNMPSLLEGEAANGDSVLVFAEQDPVHLHCREGQIVLSISLARLQSGSRQWRNFTVHVAYRPQMTGSTVELVRDGPISLAAERLSLQSQLVLRGTFSRLFPDDRPFTLLGEAFESDPRLAGLEISQFVIDDGWIAAAIGPARATAARPAMAR